VDKVAPDNALIAEVESRGKADLAAGPCPV